MVGIAAVKVTVASRLAATVELTVAPSTQLPLEYKLRLMAKAISYARLVSPV